MADSKFWRTCPLVLFLLFIPLTVAQAIAEEKPANVVLIMAGDVGYECLSAYGSREYSTPRLDALAATGIRFENCHSTPLSTPSRVNLMTGKSNVYNYQDFGLYPKGEPTFANYFKKFGYATVVAGKWQLLSEQAGITPTEAGFDSWCVWNYPGLGRHRYWDPSFNRNGKLFEPPSGSYGPDVATDFIIEFIEVNRAKPFLAYFPMILAHNPFPSTPASATQDRVDKKKRNEKEQKKNFIDMVNYMDKCVGRIVDALESNGIRERTLVVFTTDNGTNSVLTSQFKGRQLRGGKGYTHDHGTHVPLIANLPGWIPGGQVNDDLICFSDFFPTIVEAAGLKPKQITNGDGWSFWPQCRGEQGVKRNWIYGYYFPRPYSKKFDNKYKHWEVRYARDKRYKLYDDGGLYDTVEDVLEKHTISPGRAGKQAELARKELQAVLDSYPHFGSGIRYVRVTGTFGLLSVFDIIAILLTLAAIFSYINHRFLGLPTTIGLMAMALVMSLGLVAVGSVLPTVRDEAVRMLEAIDFNKTLLHGMLGYLLFAGALHVDLNDLRRHGLMIASLATIGVLISTTLVGLLTFALLCLVRIDLPLIYCLLFGALISPTDPISVMAILRSVGAPKDLEIQITGESLFNDGIGVVVFLAILAFAVVADGAPDHAAHLTAIAVQFSQEILGGGAFGLAIGLAAYWMLKSVNNYQVEVLISLALVTGGYALAHQLHLSGPIAIVVAGLLIGNHGRALAMSDTTRQHLDAFWELIDEILNAVLFVLLGLEVLVLWNRHDYLLVALVAVPIVLLARFVAVGVPARIIRRFVSVTPHVVKLMTWGGLRGGISVALALSLREHLGQEAAAAKDLILIMTYVVVVFSILVQGLSLKVLTRKWMSNGSFPVA